MGSQGKGRKGGAGWNKRNDRVTGGLLACRSSRFLPVPPFLPFLSAGADRTTRNHRQRAFAGPGHARLEPPLVGASRRSVTDRVNGRAQGRPRDRVGHVGQLIVHPQPVPARANKTGPPKMGEMPRDRWLRQPEGLVKVAHAHFTVGEHPENPKAGRVGERSEHPRELMNPGHSVSGAKCTMPTSGRTDIR